MGRLCAHLMKASELVASGRVTSVDARPSSLSCTLHGVMGKEGDKAKSTWSNVGIDYRSYAYGCALGAAHVLCAGVFRPQA